MITYRILGSGTRVNLTHHMFNLTWVYRFNSYWLCFTLPFRWVLPLVEKRSKICPEKS